MDYRFNGGGFVVKYIIMADGKSDRWQNYNSTPKHLIEINGEPILKRTVRLLKENGIENIIITSHDKRYNFAKRYEPQNNEYEIDRFYSCLPIWESEMVFLYGDVFYSEECIRKIINDTSKETTYFGRLTLGKKKYPEIFAIKVMNNKQFEEICKTIRESIIDGSLERGIGWETYKLYCGKDLYMSNDDLTRWVTETEQPNFININDETDDFDYPEDLDRWLEINETKYNNTLL